MKYFDNIIFYLQNSGGGSVYWGELMKRFNIQNRVEFIEPNGVLSKNIIRKELSFKKILTEKKIPISVLRYLPVTLSLDQGSFFHSSYYRFSNNTSIKNIVTVHDFVYERYFKGLKKSIHHQQKRVCVNKSLGVICISESTKKDLLHFIPSAEKKRIKVIYNGVSADFMSLSKSDLKKFEQYELFNKKKVVLYVGHRSLYKNFLFAIKVIEALGSEFYFAIVGSSLNNSEKKLLDSTIAARYSVFANASLTELNYIYNLAHCLLYPSSYEGFGIPVLEAFKCGCPVIALDTSSIPEVAKNAAILLKELSISSFAKKIKDLSSCTLRKELIGAGIERVSHFSWDKCFQELNNFYDDLK